MIYNHNKYLKKVKDCGWLIGKRERCGLRK